MQLELTGTRNGLKSLRSSFETHTTKLELAVKQLKHRQNATDSVVATVTAEQTEITSEVSKMGQDLKTTNSKLNDTNNR